MKIAVAGYGLEGKAAFEYWNTSEHDITIVDERATPDGLPAEIPTITGPDAFSKLGEFDLIIRSPSIHPKKLPYSGKVWSTTNEFFEKCPAPIIGVTGTKGKGTTSSLIASILRAAEYTVHLVGNIGTPAISELKNITPNDIVVFELSSFQLWDIQKSPHVAVVLGIEPDHLDVHDSMEEYVAAKANITKFQSGADTLVFNANNTVSCSIAETSQASKITYPYDMTELADSLVIPGDHNVENASAAVAAVREYVSDTDTIRRGLSSFTGLPHRIKFIRDVGGVRFYDDSYSSAPSASIAALKSFTGDRVILLGGFEKGADFSELAAYIAGEDSVYCVVYGATRHRVAAALASAGVPDHHVTVLNSQNFKEIITTAQSTVATGVVVLSPGCASFDMFKNFTDRGEQFIAIVESL